MMEGDISENILLGICRNQFQDFLKTKEESAGETYCQLRKEEQDKCDLKQSFRTKTSS